MARERKYLMDYNSQYPNLRDLFIRLSTKKILVGARWFDKFLQMKQLGLKQFVE